MNEEYLYKWKMVKVQHHNGHYLKCLFVHYSIYTTTLLWSWLMMAYTISDILLSPILTFVSIYIFNSTYTRIYACSRGCFPGYILSISSRKILRILLLCNRRTLELYRRTSCTKSLKVFLLFHTYHVMLRKIQ